MVSFVWTMNLFRRQWTAEELNPDSLVAGQMSCRWTSSPVVYSILATAFGLYPPYRSAASVACPGIEPDLPPYQNGVLPEHLQTVRLFDYRLRPSSSLSVGGLSCFPDEVEPSSPACRTGVVPLDHGTAMTEVGVEPTKSPGSRPGRFASLRTQSSASAIPPEAEIAGPGVAPGRRSL